jgi:autotransporter-associated beta strand protein
MIALMGFWQVVSPLQGATYYWDSDSDGLNAVVGGTGFWDTTSAQWDTDNDNTNDTNDVWTSSGASIALFAGDAGTVTLTEPVTAGGLIYDASGYVVTGGTLTLAAPAGTAAATVDVKGLGSNARLASVLAGNVSLAKTGTGTLILGSTANTYTGDTVINDGALVVTDEDQLGTADTVISVNGIGNTGNPGFSGGQLILQGGLEGMTMTRSISVLGRGPGAANAVGALVSVGNNTLNGQLIVAGPASEGRVTATHGITTINGPVLLGSGATNLFFGNGNFIINGKVSGYDTAADRFIKSGNVLGSTLWLTNLENDFRETVRPDSGTIRVSDNRALGVSTTTRAIDFASGGILEVHTDNPNFETRNVHVRAVTGHIFVDRALDGSGLNETVEFGNLELENGTMRVTGRNGYNFVINGQTGAGTTTSWSGAGNAAFTNDSNGLYTFDGSIRKSDTTARTFTVQGNGDMLITGDYLGEGGGAHALTKTGTGTLTIQGTNGTYTGATNVQAGTLSIRSFGAINSTTGTLNIGSSGTTAAVEFTGSAETSAKAINLAGTTGGAIVLANGTGPLTLSGVWTATGAGSKTLTVGGANTDDNTISGSIVNNSGTNVTSVLKIGPGTWMLTGANAYTGTTTIAGGTMKLQDTYSGASRNVVHDASAIVFGTDVYSFAAGGTLEYLGDGTNASTETLGALSASAGGNTVKVTAGAGGTAALTFTSLGTMSVGSGINFVTNTGGSLTLTGATNTNGILNAHLFYNGADFASGSSVTAASYTTEATGASLVGGNTLPYLVTTADITAQATATVNAGIKFGESRNLTLAAGATLTLNNGGTGVSGGVLVTGGSSVVVSGGTGITSGGAADLVFRTDGAGDTLTLNSAIASSTTGGWTKLGAGMMIVGAANANGGTVSINEGTVKLAAGGKLGADSIDVTLLQGATLDLNGFNLGDLGSAVGSLDLLNGAGTITNSAVGTLSLIRVGNANSTGLFSGIIEDGLGKIGIVKTGTGSQRIMGAQNFSGPVTITAGNIVVNVLADIGVASGLGRGDATSDATNAASLVFNGGTLYYRGSDGTSYQTTQSLSVSTDRLFTLSGNGRIQSEGGYGGPNRESAQNNAAIVFRNTAPVAFLGTGNRTLTLGGNSTGDNEIALQLIDNTNGGVLALSKADGALWILSNVNNSYSGATTISGGALRVGDDSSDLTRSLSSNSALVLSAGVLQTSGIFSRAVVGTALANNVTWTGTGAAGFAASTSALKVNLGGAGDTLQWAANGFMGTGGTLLLSSSTSWADVDFQNGIDLNAASGTVFRNIQVDDNGFTGLDYATISGVISNSGPGTGGLILQGGGILILGDENTYNGTTRLNGASVIVSSIGNVSGTTASSLGASGGSLEFSTNGTQNFFYVGAGETTDRPIVFNAALSAARTYRIDSSGSGALVITNLQNNRTGNFGLILELRGQNTDGNRLDSAFGDGLAGGTAIAKFDGGVWILNNPSNTFSGGTRADGGALGLIDGGALGAMGSLAPTTAASSSSTTVTVASTAGLKPGMYVNGTGVGYGDFIVSITNGTQFVLSTARTITAGTTLQFGGLMMSNGGIFAADPLNGLVIDQPVFFNNNTTNVFMGAGDITLNGAFQLGVGNNVNTFSNNLENGKILTINSDLVNFKANNQTLNLRGFGSTVWNGVIGNSVTGQTTALDVRLSSNASFTTSGAPNTYTGGTLLGQGILIIDKVNGLGPSGNFTFDGGVVTVGPNMTDLAGANAIVNPVILAGDPATVNGTKSVEFSGAVTNSGGDRQLVNDLGGTATLTLSGGVNLSNDATSRTLTVRGSGNTIINSVIANGGTAPASAFRMRGTGKVTLTAANTYKGGTSVENGVLELSGNGTLDQASVITASGDSIFRIDNSTVNNGNRVADAQDINLDHGTLEFVGHASGSSESFGRLDINGNGLAKIDVSGGNSTLTFASINFANTGSSLDVSGIPSLGVNHKVLFTTAPSGTLVSNGIISRIMVGTDFAEYDTTAGLRAFTGYNTSNNLATAGATDTLLLTAGVNLTGSTTANAVKLHHATGVSIGETLAGSALTLTSGGLIATGGGTHHFNVSLLNTGANGGFFQVAAGTTLRVNGAMTGAAFTLFEGGNVEFNAKQFFNSTTNLHGGTLKLNGGLNTLMALKQSLFVNKGATLDLNGNTQFVGNLTTSGTQPGDGGSVISSTGTGTIITDNGGNWMGEISGHVNLGRVGGGTLTIGSAQTYDGWTYIIGGTTVLRDDATFANTSGIDINQATLTLSNNENLQIQNNDRINDAAAINLRGGTINFNGRVHTDATETLGDVSALLGANSIASNWGGTGTAGAFASSTLTIASLAREKGATVNFTGSNLGAPGNNARILISSSMAVLGDGILGAWAIANSSDYAAYNGVNGVGVVGSGGFAGYHADFGSGHVTNLGGSAAVALTTTLNAGTTTTGLLRFHGGVTNDLAFTNAGDTLHLQWGGILRSNNNNATTIGSTATRGIITSGTDELVVFNNQNVLTIHSIIQGATSLVKSGAGTLTLTALNTFNGGTVVNQGTLRLEGGAGTVVIPIGGLIINGATVTMVGNQGQIASSNSITLNGSSTLTLVGDNTFRSINFNHLGGSGAPTITNPGTLTLTDTTAITVTTRNAIGLPIINGIIDIGSTNKIFDIGAIVMNGVLYDNSINASLQISGSIVGTASLTKSGAGLLRLSGASTFSGGLNITGGGIVLSANSTSTTLSGGLTSGPLGVGTLTMAAGTSLSADDSSRTVANAITFAGNPIFSNTGGSTDTLTLNGALTFGNLTTAGTVVNVDTPYLNVSLAGRITNIGSMTAIGSGSGANTFKKTGLGNIVAMNLTGISSTATINLTNLTNASFTLLHDGDGTSGFETINLGAVTWEPINNVLTLTIGRAGTGEYYATPAYKTISLASLNSSALPNGITLTNSNGYGLVLSDNIALNATNSFNVVNANTSLQPVGLTLNGVLSGSGITKTGNGVLKLGNSGNTFTGTVDITNGTVEAGTDGAFGNASNVIQIGSNSLTEGLRISGTFATNRIIHLNAASSGIDVTGSNTFTLNNAFTFATATNAFAKNDLGTLVLTQAQTGWDGVMNINQGVLRITNAGALGSTVGNTSFGNVGAALELVGGLSIAEPLVFNSGDDVTSNGINGGGAVRAVSGVNTLSGAILINTASGTNDRSRAATFSVDSGAELHITGVVTGTVGSDQNRDSWIGLGGEGEGYLDTAMVLAGTPGTNRFFSINKFGSGKWSITAANAHPGTRVIIKEGTLALSGAGTLGTPTAGQEAPTVYLNPIGVLLLDSTTTDVDHRLSGRALNVSGADVTVLGNAAGTNETVGAFTLREGLSIFTLDAHASGELNFATGTIARSAGATLLVRGDNLGSVAGPGVATFTGNAYAFVGQLGDNGTTNKSILPWAIGDTSLTGGGAGFLTSDSTGAATTTGTNRLRFLTAAEQTTTLVANANVNLTTSQTLSTALTINSLLLGSGGSIHLDYAPLALDSGGLIALSGNGGISGPSGASYITSTSNRELILHTVGDLTLDVPIAGTTGTLTKSGAGTLTLTAGNTNHSTVFVNDGTLKLGGGDHTILPGRSLQLNHGATVDLNGNVQHFNLLESRLTAVLAQTDLFSPDSGGVVTNSSTTQATLALATGNVTFAGSIQGNVAVVRSHAAGAFQDWNLYSAQTYTGPSLFNGGRTQLLIEGSIANSASIEVSNSSFVLSGSNGTTDAQNITDRIGDSIPIALRGAAFHINTSAAYYTTETLGGVTLGGGQNLISMTEGGTRVNQWDLTIASLTRAAGSRSTLRFYGIDADPNDNARLFITNAPVLQNHIIGGWAVFEREFASYQSGQGVGALNTQGYAGYSPRLINDGTATDNIRIALPAAGGTTALTGNRTIHTLNLSGSTTATGSSILDLGGHTLTLTGGGIIASNGTNDFSITLQNGNLTAGTLNVGGDLYLHTFGYVNGNTDVVNRDVNIDVNLVDNGTGAVTVVINGDDGRGTGLAGALNGSSTNITGNNSYSGGTYFNAGRIILNTTNANGSTITATGSGDVVIAGGASTLGNDVREFTTTVIFNQAHQIAQTATVTIMGGAVLNLNNFNTTLDSIVFDNNGGTTPQLTSGTGTLTLTGGITASGQNLGSASQIDGKLNFASSSATIVVNPVAWNGENLNPLLSNLVINAVIEGTNIVKTGGGLLRLSGANAYTGTFHLQEGGLSLNNNNALSSGPFIIGEDTYLTSTSDARVIVNPYTVEGDFALRDVFNLTLSGSGTLTVGSHAISVDMATKVLSLGGILGGAGSLNKTGDGILHLGNSNTYAGSTTVSDGVLRLGVADALPTNTALTVREGAMLDITLGGSSVTVGSLAGDSATQGGRIVTTATSGTTTFTAGGDNTSTAFGGVISNAAGSTMNFVKTGTGTLTLGGKNQYNGTTTVANGRLVARAVSGGSALGTSQAIVFGGTSTSGILQLGDASGPLNQTFSSISSQGSGTQNKIVSGNSAMSTLTLDLAATSSFAGNIGGAGANEANLNLVKAGAGDLVIRGSGTSTYTGSTTVSAGKLFMDTPGAFSANTTSLTLADGTEFALRGTSGAAHQIYGFTGTGNVITVGSSTGGTLGFAIDGAFNTQLHLAAGQTMTVNGSLTTAIYVNGAPIGGQQYVLINGTGVNSLHAGSGTFNLNPVIFNGGSFIYSLSLGSGVNGGGQDQLILTATSVAAAADVWWKGDLTGLGTGVWSAATTAGVGFPSNWDTDQTSGIDALVPPDAQSIVHFSASGAANFNTTLGANLTIQELIFHTGNAATSIGSSNGINTLTLGNGTDPSGLTIQAGANNVLISAIVRLAKSQSWNIEDASRVLTLSGGLTGTGVTLTVNDLVTNPGTLLFSGAAASMTGTLKMNAGSLVFEDTGSLNSGLNVLLGTATSFATLQVGGATAASYVLIGGLGNDPTFISGRVIGGNAAMSTLALGPETGTFTFDGALGGAGANQNQFNLEKTGAGTQVLNGAVTYAGTTIVRDGTLQLGTASTFAPTGALSVIANAGAIAIFDINGRSITSTGTLTLGGGAGGQARIIDSNSTKGKITLGGDVSVDGLNDPGEAVISANLVGDGATRTITVNDSLNATTELTLNGTFTTVTDHGLIIAGAGNGVINGNIFLNLTAGSAGQGNDITFNTTGTWTINAKVEVDDDVIINTGVVNATVGESLDALDDVIIDGTGVQGSAILNISSTAQIHTGDDFFIRNGARVNVTASGGIGTGTDLLLVGDSSSGSAASAGVLNLVNATISPTSLQLGATGNFGNIVGNGTITTTGTKTLQSGSIEAGIVLAGNGAITKSSTGTVIFSGERDAASTGGTNLQEGTLNLDYSANNNSKIGGTFALGANGILSQATLVVDGNSSADTVQSVAGTTILTGDTNLIINHAIGRATTLNLGAFTRTTSGGTVLFHYASGSAKAASTSPAGTLGWATVKTATGIERLAAINGVGDIVQATTITKNDVSQWAAGDNVITSGAVLGTVQCTEIASLTFAGSATSNVNIATGGHLTISSGGIMVDSDVGAFNATISGGELRGSTTGALGDITVHQHNTLGTLTIASNIIRSSGITKTGAGTLILTGNNTFLTTSQVGLNEGKLVVSGGNAIGDTTALWMRNGTTFDINNSNEVIGHLGTGNGTLVLGTGKLTINQTASTAWSGLITGGAASSLVINGGTTNLNLTGNTSTGFAGTVVVNSGLLQLSGSAARLSGVTSFTFNKGANFLLDNNDDNSPNDRISDSAAFVLNSADGAFSGETRPRGLAIRTDNNGNESETIGALTIASGANYASLEASGGTSSQADIIASSWTRNAGATLNVRGRALGAAAAANNSTRFKVLDANDASLVAGNIGGGGVVGGTAKNVSITPWAIGENLTGALGDTNMGNTLVTYVDNRGFVPLSFSEYNTYAAAGAQDNTRESLTANLTGLAGKTINSLVIHNNSTAASTINVTGAGAGQSLINSSGAFLFTLNTGATASTAHTIRLGGFDDGIKVGTTNEYVFFVVNPSSATTTPTLTAVIESPLNATAVSLTKSGRGTLELTAVNTYGGGTTINEGVLLVHDNDNLGAGGITLAGGTLRLASDFADDLGALSTPALNVLTGGGTLEVLGTSVTMTDFVISGTGTLTKLGAGNVQVTGSLANTHTGDFHLRRGIMDLNKAAGVTAIASANLYIGFSSVTNETATVRLQADNQISDATNVIIRSAGTGAIGQLDLNGHAETIGSLHMSTSTGSGVLVRTGAGGVLTVNGDITLSNDRTIDDTGTNPRNVVITGSGTNSTVAPNTGFLDLGGATRTITVETTGTATMATGRPDATIETAIQNGGVVKEGSRVLHLSAANTYTGGTTIRNGGIELSGSLAAGNVLVSKTNGSLADAAVLTGAGNGTTTGVIGGPVTLGEVVGGNVCGVGILRPGLTTSPTVNTKGTLTISAPGLALTVNRGSQIQFGITSATMASDGFVAAIGNGTATSALDYLTNVAPAEAALWNVAPGNPNNHDYTNLTGALSQVSVGDRAGAAWGEGSIVVSGVSITGLAYGQVFNLMDWMSLSAILGDFDIGSTHYYDATNNVSAGDLDLPSLGAGYAWDVSAFEQYGVLVVVPEPGRVLLFLVGLMALVMRRRRAF